MSKELIDAMGKRITELLDRMAELEKAVKALAELAHRAHTYCEDSWYSCPMAEGGCADERRGPECDCGAAEHNAKVAALLVILKEKGDE